MTRAQLVGLLWAAGAMAIVASGLAARRVARGRLVVLALVWSAMFAAAYGIVVAIRADERPARAPSRQPRPGLASSFRWR